MDKHSLTLEILPGTFAVAQLGPTAETPSWALTGQLTSITRTSSELSIICEQSLIPEEIKAQRGFRVMRVAGSLDFSEIGILVSLAAPLAQVEISIIALSTYDTDYLLLPVEGLPTAIGALTQAGHTIKTLDDV